MDVFVSSIQRPPVYQLGWETPLNPSCPLPLLLLHTYVYGTYTSGRNGRVSIARVLNVHDALSAAIARARRGCQCGVSPIMCTIIQCYMARRPPLATQFHPTAFGRCHSLSPLHPSHLSQLSHVSHLSHLSHLSLALALSFVLPLVVVFFLSSLYCR